MEPPSDAEVQPGGVPSAATRVAPAEHPTALAAYYTGIFALFPGAGLFMGPAALWLGIKGLAAIQGDPHASGKSRAVAAVLMGVLTTLFNWGAIVYFVWARGAGRS